MSPLQLQKSLLDPNCIPTLLGVSCLACLGRLSNQQQQRRRRYSSSSTSSSNGNSILIVIMIVCNITWVNITFVIIIISSSSNGAGDVGRKSEVIDAWKALE